MGLLAEERGDHPQMAQTAATKSALARHGAGNHIALGQAGIHGAAVDAAQIVGRACTGARRQDHAGRAADRGRLAPRHPGGMAEQPGHGLAHGEVIAFGGAGGDLESDAAGAGRIKPDIAAPQPRAHHHKEKGEQRDQGGKTLGHRGRRLTLYCVRNRALKPARGILWRGQERGSDVDPDVQERARDEPTTQKNRAGYLHMREHT